MTAHIIFNNQYWLYAMVFLMNVLSFALMGYDKHLAHYHQRRIPEAVLLCITLLTGAFGALCGMVLFNHKTRKTLFLITVPVLLFAQLAALAFYFMI